MTTEHLGAIPIIRVAVDPGLVDDYGPEIHWALRLWFSTAGWAWAEVAPREPADLAYGVDRACFPGARLFIQARPDLWARRAELSFRRARSGDGPPCVIYDGEPDLGGVDAHAEHIVCRQDLVFDTFFVATGQMERGLPRGKHGFYDLSDFSEYRRIVLADGLVSDISRWIEKTLTELGCAPPVTRWPAGRRAALALSHDVDYPEMIRWIEPARILRRQGLAGWRPAAEVAIGRHHHWHFASWMHLEQAQGARSAFYFVARQGSLFEYATGTPDTFYDIGSPAFRKLFGELRQAGFEIGLHASYRAFASPERFAAEIAHLEAVSGGKVVGNRHHYWHMDPSDPEATLKLHESLGLAYDSSLIHNRYVGWRRGIAHPYYPFVQAERREIGTLQVPATWMDNQLFGLRGDNPGDPWELLKAVVDRAVALGGCVVVDIHDYVFDRVLFPGWAELYERLIGLVAARSDFWIATPAEVAEHWRERMRKIRAASQGLALGVAQRVAQ